MSPNFPIKRLSLSQTNRPCDVILHWHRSNSMMLDAPYQRGDVWSDQRRVNLIKSILLGVPIPSIIINDRFSAGWDDNLSCVVIDGKQRITSILRFMLNQLFVPGEWFGMDGQITYDKLPDTMRRRFHNTPLAYSEGTLKSLEEEQEVFNLVNYGGVPQGQTDL